ncbi:MAG: class II fructose-bisphosphate aldolase family protein, partial [Gammaproteobacteria bacterium]|nr:class II fructose-bisphosphate aldolase family protein [Gammaproteobacteria bacterium]
MPLVRMDDMLQHAYKNRYAIAAFDVVSLDFISGIINAAEETRSPIIISLAESHFEYFDFELLMSAVVTSARRTSVPVAIHLDHGESLESAINGINLGCTGVMVDASNLPLEKNIEHTKAVVEMAHACGIPVEGELGYVPGVEGEDAERHPGEVIYTTVDEAKSYVDATGVDFLAVSIGTVHGRMKGEPKLDFDRLAEINQALQIPLVIHGGTGLSEKQFLKLIDNGVTKINYYTALADAAGRCIQQNNQQNASGYTSMVKGVINAIQQEAIRCIKLWGSAGKADELLNACRPWKPVDHVILFNTEGLDENGVNDMMAEGHRVLSNIPGVNDVFTGHAIQDDAGYKHCWVVRFTDKAVI